MESSHGYSVMKVIAGVLIDRLVKLPLNLQDHSLSATQPLPVGTSIIKECLVNYDFIYFYYY